MNACDKCRVELPEDHTYRIRVTTTKRGIGGEPHVSEWSAELCRKCYESYESKIEKCTLPYRILPDKE